MFIAFSAQCQDWDIRLVEGATDMEGRLEVCLNQRWGTVSHQYYYGWSSDYAQAVCNQLGYSSTGNYNACHNLYFTL